MGGEPKRCSRCVRELPREAFASNRSMRDGLQAYCRECSAEYCRQGQEGEGRTVRTRAAVPPGHQRRRRCCEAEPHADRGRGKTASGGWAGCCRTRRAQRDRGSRFLREHGLTRDGLRDRVARRHGICAICLEAEPEHVDHVHRTGRVRGVACSNCNAALGQFKDQPDIMRRAADYVEGIVWKPTLVAPGVCRLPS